MDLVLDMYPQNEMVHMNQNNENEEINCKMPSYYMAHQLTTRMAPSSPRSTSGTHNGFGGGSPKKGTRPSSYLASPSIKLCLFSILSLFILNIGILRKYHNATSHYYTTTTSEWRTQYEWSPRPQTKYGSTTHVHTKISDKKKKSMSLLRKLDNNNNDVGGAPQQTQPQPRQNSQTSISRTACQTQSQCEALLPKLNITSSTSTTININYHVGKFPNIYGCFIKTIDTGTTLYWGEGGNMYDNSIWPLSGRKERVWCEYTDTSTKQQQLLTPPVDNLRRDDGVGDSQRDGSILNANAVRRTPGGNSNNQMTNKENEMTMALMNRMENEVHMNFLLQEDEEEEEEEEESYYGVSINSKHDIYRMIDEIKDGTAKKGKIAWLMRYSCCCYMIYVCVFKVLQCASTY